MSVRHRAAIWWIFWSAVLLAVPTWADAAEPKSRALLVGVSDYPKEAVGDLQLTGPRNDVALMIDTIGRLGIAAGDAIVLADGLEQTGSARKADGLPTHAAIMAALARLAAESRPGDFVLVYLSGHGSQQPDLDPARRAVPKPDGLDEIFLPIDIGHWDDGVAAVQNALVDFEFGAAIRAIRARGATVFVVVDACHSGTMTRSGPGDAVARRVPPAALGVSDAALADARRRASALVTGAATRGTATAANAVDRLQQAAPPPAADPETSAPVSPTAAEGGYVAFFAAYPDQLALQKALPRGYGTTLRKPHGVLTFNLAEAIRSGRAATFRDLAHRVLAGYEQFGAQAPTPMFEGDLARRLPGSDATATLRWPARRTGDQVIVSGGVVDGIGPGAVLGLYQPDDPAAPMAFMRVETASAAEAAGALVARDGIPADAATLPEGDLLVAGLVETGVDFAFRVAMPAGADGGAEAVRAALQALVADRGDPLRVEAVEPDAAADVRLVVDAGRLWLTGDDGRLQAEGRSRSPSLPLPSDPARLQAPLREALSAMVKARNLARISATLGTGPLATTVAVEAFLVRDAGSILPASAAPNARAPDDRPCAPLELDRVPALATPFADLAAAGLALPDLGQCDTLYFRLRNNGAKPVDVTPLYIDGAGGIAYMGPPEGLRLEPGGGPRIVPIRIVTWSQKRGVPLPIGLERLLLVLVEIEARGALPADFRYLAQSAPGTNRSASGPAPLRELLEAAAFGSATRSATAPVLSAAGIADFRWRVVAP